MIANPAATILLLAALAVLTSPGCERTTATHDDHLEHHVPEHKPPDLHTAIDQIEHRFEALAHGEVPDAERTTRLKELVDIVRWLPEIAGDSDLPEEPWNTVDQVSQQLLPPFQKALSDAQAGAEVALEPSHSAVDAALERLYEVAEKLPIEPIPAGDQHDHGDHQRKNHD